MLETARLRLDPWQPDDFDAFHPIATNPEVMRYITGGTPWTDERIRQFVDSQVRLFSDRGFCRWRLIDKSTATMIGFCGIAPWRAFPWLEIGWWLAPAWWGRGLATEAARTALADAFERVGLDRIHSVAMPANTASIRIMQKLGLEFETNFENEGVALVRYAIDRAGWGRRISPSP
jgi:ribosomal-protein-alanine N-acetyltransferase